MNFNPNGELLLKDLRKEELNQLKLLRGSRFSSLKQDLFLSVAKFLLKTAIKLLKKANESDEKNLPVGIKIEKIKLTSLNK